MQKGAAAHKAKSGRADFAAIQLRHRQALQNGLPAAVKPLCCRLTEAGLRQTMQAGRAAMPQELQKQQIEPQIWLLLMMRLYCRQFNQQARYGKGQMWRDCSVATPTSATRLKGDL